ncbi:MAG: hypothetical protein NVS4B11_13420 [Ktedonobacteraceae bacterium]
MATKRRVSLAQRMRRLQRAEQSKWNKYTWSGLLIVLVGLVLIGYGLSLHTGAYSGEGLAVGIGALVVLAGIIRTLIGFINPSSPEELIPYEEQDAREAEREEGNTLDDQLFEHEGDKTL